MIAKLERAEEKMRSTIATAMDDGADIERVIWQAVVADKDVLLADKDALLKDKDARIAELEALLDAQMDGSE